MEVGTWEMAGKERKGKIDLETGYQRKLIIHTVLYPLYGKREEEAVGTVNM